MIEGELALLTPPLSMHALRKEAYQKDVMVARPNNHRTGVYDNDTSWAPTIGTLLGAAGGAALQQRDRDWKNLNLSKKDVVGPAVGAAIGRQFGKKWAATQRAEARNAPARRRF